ncbi:MAG: helix-turn-helix transcriptional regulator [Alicyclobacillus macrosporangiidus]|uniref:winged helix-turn-helix transcriptional regulator n=1 Tax=Alicyclobacillus macrosporangiidus TaxID=392015 RepID=UPI0026EA6AC5|nr:helix-turn-helix domain-containing protein [Alicyclobacillus macrosporangiidus]MCL6600712.1 helix-turn-helix transcriptional regulator [Alicyclobacillus macrosporangiidus]
MGDEEFKRAVETTLNVIGGKWKPMILCHLQEGPKRFGELQRSLPGITAKMLTQQLRELEQDGLVNRQVYAQIPPKVEYSLTECGRTTQEVLDAMSRWGRQYRRQPPGVR